MTWSLQMVRMGPRRTSSCASSRRERFDSSRMNPRQRFVMAR